jgi:glycosyltransferase involved in cell wall biosynthesis
MTALAKADPALQPATRDTPLPVSFIVTSYNKAAYLPAVLETVWREATAIGGEVILVDDGSTDGSERICEAFAASHDLASYRRQENRGVYATINSIASGAKGAWIRFCDSDDPLIPGSTARLIRAAQSQGAGVAYGTAIAYGPNPLPADRLHSWPGPAKDAEAHSDALMYLIRGMNFTPSMSVYSRAALVEALPLPAGLISCQDLAMLFPALRRNKLARIDEPVCFNLKGAPNQLSANYALTIHQTIRITRHFADLLSPDHKRAALLKAANRTRRWLRGRRGSPGAIAEHLWLLTVTARARLGHIEFKDTLEKIATIYEHDLAPILAKRVRPY